MVSINISPRAQKDLLEIKEFDFETGYRFLVCGQYTAFYRCEDDTVYVDRVIYGRRDFMRILFGDVAAEEGN